MADVTRITKLDRTLFVDDGAKRGPMTMVRVRYHPREPRLVAQVVDRRLAWFDLTAEPTPQAKGNASHVVGSLVCSHEIGWIRALDFHPKGDAIVTGGSDRTLRLWEWSDGRPAEAPSREIQAHQGWVEGVAWSPDGRWLVSAGADAQIKVWNGADLSLVESLAGHTRHATDVVFTHDGHLFLTGAEDGRVLVWETATRRRVRQIDFGGANEQFGQQPRHSGVHRLAVSHDDRWLGVAGGESLQLYDLETGEIVAAERSDMQVAFHPQTNLLAAGESEVKFWRYAADQLSPPGLDKQGKPMKPNPVPGQLLTTVKRGEWSLGLRFAPDGKQAAIGKADGTVELYEVA